MDYRKYLNSKHWQKIRKRALRRADKHCQVCGGVRDLNVHHNTYTRLKKERMADVVVLCRSCHEKFHGVMPKPEGVIPPIGDLENLRKVLHI